MPRSLGASSLLGLGHPDPFVKAAASPPERERRHHHPIWSFLNSITSLSSSVSRMQRTQAMNVLNDPFKIVCSFKGRGWDFMLKRRINCWSFFFFLTNGWEGYNVLDFFFFAEVILDVEWMKWSLLSIHNICWSVKWWNGRSRAQDSWDGFLNAGGHCANKQTLIRSMLVTIIQPGDTSSRISCSNSPISFQSKLLYSHHRPGLWVTGYTQNNHLGNQNLLSIKMVRKSQGLKKTDARWNPKGQNLSPPPASLGNSENKKPRCYLKTTQTSKKLQK